MYRLLRLIGFMLIAALLLGNSQCQQNVSGTGNESADNGPAFVTTLTVEDADGTPTSQFTEGQTIQFAISVHNRLGTPQTIVLSQPPCAITPYSVAVVAAGTSNLVFWGNNPTMHCMLAVMGGYALTFSPYQTMNFVITWNQTEANEQLVAPGNYEVMGGIGCVSPPAGYAGPAVFYDAADCMPLGPATPEQLTPTQFRSALQTFSIQ